MEIRLTTAVNTLTAKVDQAFDAVVIAPVVAGNRIVIAAGVKVKGHVKEVKAAVNPDDQAVWGWRSIRSAMRGGKKANASGRVGRRRQRAGIRG